MTTIDPQIPVKTPTPRPPRELLSSTSHLLKRVGWAIKERSMEAFEATGLNPAHYAVLVLLEEEPRETQAMIADALGYDRSHLVGMLDELEERALIERKRDPGDRRRHLVTLTPEGKKTLTRLRAIVKANEAEVLAPLDAQQREQLHTLLQVLAGHLDERYAS
jgi:DNA-binding MarR family transcriptional regulator